MKSLLTDSSYRNIYGSSYLKPCSTTTCIVTLTQNKSAVGLVETHYINVKGKP